MQPFEFNAVATSDESISSFKSKAFSRADWVFSSFCVADGLVIIAICMKIWAASGLPGSAELATGGIDPPEGTVNRCLLAVLLCSFSVDFYLAVRIIEELKYFNMGVINTLAGWNSITNTFTLAMWLLYRMCNPSNIAIFGVVFIIRICKLIPMIKFSRGTKSAVTDNNWVGLEEFGKYTEPVPPYTGDAGVGSDDDETSAFRWSKFFGWLAMCICTLALVSLFTAPAQIATSTPTALPGVSSIMPTTPAPVPAVGRRLDHCYGGKCDGDGFCTGFGMIIGGGEGVSAFALIRSVAKHPDKEFFGFLAGIACLVGGTAAAFSCSCDTEVPFAAFTGGVAGVGVIVAIVTIA